MSEKIFNILIILPQRKPKLEDNVKVGEVTHERETRKHTKAERQVNEVVKRDVDIERNAMEEDEETMLQGLKRMSITFL